MCVKDRDIQLVGVIFKIPLPLTQTELTLKLLHVVYLSSCLLAVPGELDVPLLVMG